jgi:hypothetical protein
VSSQETLIGIFSRVEYYFKRLEIYASVPTTVAMRGIIMDIMVEVISFLGVATKEVKRGRTSESIPGSNRVSQLRYIQKDI